MVLVAVSRQGSEKGCDFFSWCKLILNESSAANELQRGGGIHFPLERKVRDIAGDEMCNG